LRHDKQFSADVLQREVHLAFGIREYAVAEHPCHEPSGLRFGVAAFDADQRKDAASDGANHIAVNFDARLGDALN